MSSIDVSVPVTEPDSIWLYNPNFPLSIVFAFVYLIPTAILSYQTIFKYRANFFIVVLVGAVLEVAGYTVRAVACKHLDQIPPYAIQSSFIVIAPLFIGAGNYLLISRLCLHVLPSSLTHIYHMPVARLTPIFVICDIVSFIIQVSGTGIASSQSWAGTTLTIGTNILIAGLSTQVATFAFFFAIVVKFHRLTMHDGIKRSAPGDRWRKVLIAVYISSGLIVIRSIYRTIEFSLGIFGYPFTHEWMFLVFESVPMVPAISIFCIWHPAAYLKVQRKGDEEVQMESNSNSPQAEVHASLET